MLALDKLQRGDRSRQQLSIGQRYTGRDTPEEVNHVNDINKAQSGFDCNNKSLQCAH